MRNRVPSQEGLVAGVRHCLRADQEPEDRPKYRSEGGTDRGCCRSTPEKQARLRAQADLVRDEQRLLMAQMLPSRERVVETLAEQGASGWKKA